MERHDTTLLVATLISTVTFAAGFTTPGGLKSDGKAVLDGSAYFKVFMCSNIVFFFLSAFVIYNELLEESFLAIQTVALVLRCSVGGLVFAFFSGFMAVQDNKGKGSPTESCLLVVEFLINHAKMLQIEGVDEENGPALMVKLTKSYFE
ncbi:unnamed protein product [Prunus brigantina]